MLDRRGFLQVAAAAAAMLRPGGLGRALADERITQDELLRFESLGQVTLLHFTDLHAQLKPIYFREPAVNIGVGAARGKVPHLTGTDFLGHYGIPRGSLAAYALTSEDFVSLARRYGRVGGFDRLATLVKAIRAARPGRTLLLDGGDTWQGSYAALKTRGGDMVRVANALGVDAMTGHWEFTYGTERVTELISRLEFPFLAGNVRDTTWDEPVFDGVKIFKRGGLQIGVIGQAYPYTPIANPRYLIPDWSFGIKERLIRERVDQLRRNKVDLVVLLSHNAFDIDRKLAARVSGIDVILTGHTHDALPRAVEVGKTLLIASGSHGKFLSRLDLDVKGRRVVDYRYKLIPVLSDAIAPDPEMAALVDEVRAPFSKEISRVLGRTNGLLFRRGNLNGTFDDLICEALLEERDAQIALSPGFRWGATLLPGQEITVDDLYGQTAITYPNAYRTEFSGEFLKVVLEDVADNLFNPDPYYQQGGDMVRAGNLAYRIDVANPRGSRISDMTLVSTGEAIEAAKTYVVSGWASVNEDTKGPPVYDVVSRYLERKKVVDVKPNRQVKVVGA